MEKNLEVASTSLNSLLILGYVFVAENELGFENEAQMLQAINKFSDEVILINPDSETTK